MAEKPIEVLQRLKARREAVTKTAREVSAEIAAKVEADRIGPQGMVEVDGR